MGFGSSQESSVRSLYSIFFASAITEGGKCVSAVGDNIPANGVLPKSPFPSILEPREAAAKLAALNRLSSC